MTSSIRCLFFFFFKQKTAYEMRISDWSSDVCSSDLTDAGIHDWMIPDAAVRALRLMERWAAPYQAMIAAEIVQRRRANPLDPQITEAHKHRHAQIGRASCRERVCQYG